MDSSASDSRKEIACISNFSKLSKKTTKKKQEQTNKKMIVILVNILLHICCFLKLFSSVKIHRKVEIKVC